LERRALVDPSRIFRPGSRVARTGRNRNGSFVEHDGGKPTLISRMTDGLMATQLITRMNERSPDALQLVGKPPDRMPGAVRGDTRSNVA
jgi:hypothetical protein